MAVWTANTLDRAQEWCGDYFSPGWVERPERCRSQNLTWERPIQSHCNDCGRDWYYSCSDCGSDNGYFIDDKRTAYIAPFYFCTPEDTAKEFPNVSGEPTPKQARRQRRQVRPGPVYPQQRYPQQHQSRGYVSDSPGLFARLLAYLWAFAIFAVIGLVFLAKVDEYAGEEVVYGTLIVGGLLGALMARAAMRRSSKLAWFLIIAGSILAVFLVLTVA